MKNGYNLKIEWGRTCTSNHERAKRNPVYSNAYNRLFSREGQRSAWMQRTPILFALYHSVINEYAGMRIRHELRVENTQPVVGMLKGQRTE